MKLMIGIWQNQVHKDCAVVDYCVYKWY